MNWRNLFRVKTDFPVHTESGSLKRVLGVRDLTFFGIAAIIGAGIFSSIGEACAAGGPASVYLIVICGVACAFAALCYAEFASRIPVSGSAYTYAYASFGELFAWIIGWALIMEYAIGNIYVAFSWSGYVVHLLDQVGWILPRWLVTDYSTASEMFKTIGNQISVGLSSSEYDHLWKSAELSQYSQADRMAYEAFAFAPVIAGLHIVFDAPALLINILITALVFRGVQESRNASNIMVVLKLVAIVLVIAVGVAYIDVKNYQPFMPEGFQGVMQGVSALFFTYIGFDAVSTLAEEAKNPQRDLPRGMFYSLLICTILYIFITLVLTGMVPYRSLAVGDPLAFVLGERGIDWLEYIVSIVAVVAMASVLLVFQMGQPRIWLSMSRDGLLPPAFAKIHPKYSTPSFSTIVTGLMVGVPILFTNEHFVLDFTSIGTIFAFVLVCGGVLLLPPRKEGEGKGFRMPYINGQYVFPSIIWASIVIVRYNFPGYFSSLSNVQNWDNIFTVSHGLYWILLLGLSVFTYLKRWSLIPLLGLSICAYLLTGMKANNWYWFFGWFGIGLLVYFSYGFRKSKLASN
ncbi:MAG: putative amino acid permease YhdG [Bacteroidota bacterium]|nr:amino acid permease [Bacteroidia bacterium]